MNKTLRHVFLTTAILLFGLLSSPFFAFGQQHLAGVYGVQLSSDSEYDSDDYIPPQSDMATYMNTLSELHGYAADLFRSPTSKSIALESLAKELRGGSTLNFVKQELNKQNNLDGYVTLFYLKEDLESANDREFTIAHIEIFFEYYLTTLDKDDRVAVLRALDVIVKGAIKDAVEATDRDYLSKVQKELQNGNQKEVAMKMVSPLRKALIKRLQTASDVLKEQKNRKGGKNAFWIDNFITNYDVQPDFKNGPTNIVVPGMRIIGEYAPVFAHQAYTSAYILAVVKRDALLEQGVKLEDIDLDKLASDSFDEFFGKPAEQPQKTNGKKNEDDSQDLDDVFDSDENGKSSPSPKVREANKDESNKEETDDDVTVDGDKDKDSWARNKKLLSDAYNAQKKENESEPSGEKTLDDFRLFEYLMEEGLPNWELKSFNGGDRNEYSASVREKIKRLPGGFYLQNDVLNAHEDQFLVVASKWNPESREYVSWLNQWFLDEISHDKKTSFSRKDNLHLLAAVGLLTLADEVVPYCQNLFAAVQELPDDVAWKKDFLDQLNRFFIVYIFERSTFLLYEAETKIEEFRVNQTPELVYAIAGALSLASDLDKSNSFLDRLPKSRFARLFPERLKDAAELLKNSDIAKWEKDNKEKVVGENNGKELTVGDAFDTIRTVIEKYETLIKK